MHVSIIQGHSKSALFLRKKSNYTLLLEIQRFLPNCGLGSISITILVTAVLDHILSLGNDKLLSLLKFRRRN